MTDGCLLKATLSNQELDETIIHGGGRVVVGWGPSIQLLSRPARPNCLLLFSHNLAHYWENAAHPILTYEVVDYFIHFAIRNPIKI